MYKTESSRNMKKKEKRRNSGKHVKKVHCCNDANKPGFGWSTVCVCESIRSVQYFVLSAFCIRFSKCASYSVASACPSISSVY